MIPLKSALVIVAAVLAEVEGALVGLEEVEEFEVVGVLAAPRALNKHTPTHRAIYFCFI